MLEFFKFGKLTADSQRTTYLSARAAVVGALILAFAACAVLRPNNLPIPVMGLLVAAGWRLARAWRGAAGLALRPAFAWGVLALALGFVAQFHAFLEPLERGRPTSGHWSYLSSLAVLAALISVFGARNPGGGAWALLMMMLVVIFLLPWLEGSMLIGGSGGLKRLRLEMPWSFFFALLTVAGVTNYLPTRHFWPASLVGAAMAAEWFGLVASSWTPAQRALCWSLGPGLLGCGILLAPKPHGEPAETSDLGRLWLWFRDRWGVVWALRVRERFNKASGSAGWPVRLEWAGPAGGGEPEPEAACRTLAALLTRFATPEKIVEAIGRGDTGTCPEADCRGS